MKPVNLLTVSDLASSPVWEFVNNEEDKGVVDETYVEPVIQVPASSLAGRIVGTRITLSNGRRVWAMLSNIDTTSETLTEQFMTLSVENDGNWFHLARYHDFDYTQRGPEQLAQFLGLGVDDVFPITYDVRSHVLGDPKVLCGVIRKDHIRMLSRAELIELAVPRS